jgi:hypothetical protein
LPEVSFAVARTSNTPTLSNLIEAVLVEPLTTLLGVIFTASPLKKRSISTRPTLSNPCQYGTVKQKMQDFSTKECGIQALD